MKKYIIEHYKVSNIYFARINRRFSSYIRIYYFHDPEAGDRDCATRFETMKDAEHAIMVYHEFTYKSTVRQFDVIINEDRLKRIKGKEISIKQVAK